jgi:sugar O-acyltransferase (sialic acid O-acetyltransferase NeuD family)
MKKKLILIGGGGHCRSCIDVIEESAEYKIVGVLDMLEKVGQNILGYKIIGTDESIPQLAKKDYSFLITIGQVGPPIERKRLFSSLKACEALIATIISPRAYVSRHAKVSEGTIVMHNALVNTNASIGKNCIVNSNALIEHDVVVEDNCHISTSTVINGGVLIGEGSFLGSNAITKENVVLKKDSFIKAGSVFSGEKVE